MTCGTLTLLGTVHLYRELGPRLYRHLEAIKPDVITVEISRFSLRFRQRAMPVWFGVLQRNIHFLPPEKRGHAGLRLLVRQLRMPFEWSVARQYAKMANIRCIPVDTGAFSRLELPAWHCELINIENLKIITSEPDFELSHHFEARKNFANMFLQGKKKCCKPAHPLAYLGEEQWQERENLLARRIQRVSQICSSTVHICGWTHLVTGSPWLSLADMLAPLEAQRVLVY